MGDLASLRIRSWEVLTTSLTGAALRIMRSGIPTVVGRGRRRIRGHEQSGLITPTIVERFLDGRPEAVTDPLRSGGQA